LRRQRRPPSVVTVTEGREMGTDARVSSRDDGTRDLDDKSAEALHIGDDHYLAYVGDPADYDLMGAMQFRLLTTMGLRHQHTVLDYGCGSLRLGRLLIPYLDAGKYFGLEPNGWLVEEAVKRQTGADQMRLKKPTFLHHDTYGTQEFGTTFDFIVAQSVLSHAGRDVAGRVLKGLSEGLSPQGIALVTFVQRPWPRRTDTARGWVYPGRVGYRAHDIRRLGVEAGLECAQLRWYHPAQRWYAFALSHQALPSAGARLARGRFWSEARTARPRVAPPPRRVVDEIRHRLGRRE